MAMIITNDQNYKDIALAIREKNGEDILYKPSEMANAVRGLSSLNFEVVGGTTQPSNPKENTIWVNTDQEITGWSFSKQEPLDTLEGMLWIQTYDGSSVTINATKENIIQLSIILPRQFINGEWVEKPAMIYENSKWNDLSVHYLYAAGQFDMNLTGGLIAEAKTFVAGSAGGIASKPTIEYNNSYFRIGVFVAANYYVGTVSFVNKIDLTKYKTLVVKVEDARTAGSHCIIWSTLGTYSDENIVSSKALSNGNLTFDISGLSGTYDIGFRFNTSSTTNMTYCNILEIRLEV